MNLQILFVPILGFIKNIAHEMNNHNHTYFWVSDLINKKPETKAIITNLFNNPYVFITCPKNAK
jgi:hypothetical protein